MTQAGAGAEHPPVAGSVPESVDESSIRDIAGARVVRVGDFLAVAAEKEWHAIKAAQQLKVQWKKVPSPFPAQAEIYDHIRKAPVVRQNIEENVGDVAAVFANARRIVSAEYEWPFQSHASMVSACAVVAIDGDKATLWSGSQKPHYAAEGVAAILGLKPENVHGIWVAGPGSYGRNDAGDVAQEAAVLARAIGKPVRVQSMRADGIQWDPKGPASIHRARAALDDQGNVLAYEFMTKGFSRLDVNSNESSPDDTWVGQVLGAKNDKRQYVIRIPEESYKFPNKRMGSDIIGPLLSLASPLRTSHLRDPVGPQLQFGSEQFIDEVAHAAGADPVAFRLRHASEPRDQAVIRAAAEKAGWQPRAWPQRPARDQPVMSGRGIAYSQRSGTRVAIVAEVEVERRTGRIWARKFVVAHDCGLIINPAELHRVIEGNIVQTISRTLYEEVQFDRDNVTSVDWETYPIVEMRDAPEIVESVLINRPDIAPSGAGEPSCRPVPAVIANAFYDATGVRMRRVPFTPDAVREALARA